MFRIDVSFAFRRGLLPGRKWVKLTYPAELQQSPNVLPKQVTPSPQKPFIDTVPAGAAVEPQVPKPSWQPTLQYGGVDPLEDGLTSLGRY